MNVNPELVAVAIGTGALTEGRKPISDTILDLTGKEKPTVLAIDTAKSDRQKFEDFRQAFRGHFSELMGARINFLHDFKQPPTSDEVAHKLGEADAVYIAGGNSMRMMEFWAEHGIDRSLKEAASEGKVISGGSAGAIALFTAGHSDSMSYEVAEGEPWGYMFVEGLGEIDAGVCPHYDSKTQGGELRRVSLAEMMIKDGNAAEKFIGINNDAGLVVVRGLVSVTRCSDNGQVYTIQKVDGKVSESELDISEPIPASII